jgi:HAD superfamily hydrolase (TIGR01450 family)
VRTPSLAISASYESVADTAAPDDGAHRHDVRQDDDREQERQEALLNSSEGALWESYDVAMLDLDGVVYVGPDAVHGAPEHLADAKAAGLHLAYVTNNAARTPDAVAAHLRELGIDVEDGDVVTSAQAAARLLAGELPAGAAVFVIGGEGLEVALTEEGLRPVQDVAQEPVAVVSGFHRDLRWSTVIDGAILVRTGLPWVASNTDMTVPTPDGPGPGNGALVRVVAEFADREPEVAGKPKPPLFEETLRRVGGNRPLVVGDRLDTDIEGANATGYDSLLVMTGVTDLSQLVSARPELRPTYVAADLGGLGRSHRRPEVDGETVCAGGWRATVEDAGLAVTGQGDADAWWQAVATAAWRHLDATGEPVAVDGLRPPGSVDAEQDDQDEERERP